ncbi:MAG: VPLPA-CTERM sorting domain-containing protein, partial [Gammaproteobacteria bacterium]|nr:VPLPA-CTERM sorting domain-containing protein [Gammaproteobacteria bacterium]
FGDHRGTGTTILQGTTSISGSGFRLDGGRVLQNDGTLTWSSGGLLFNNTFTGASGGPGSGTINNRSGGLFIASGNGASSIFASNFGGADTGSDAVFNNVGTFRKAGSDAANTTTVDVGFNNTGAVQAQSGVLNFNRGLSGTSGALQIDAPGKVTLSAPSTTGTLTHNGSASDGLNLGTNTLTVATDYTNANFGAGNNFNRRANVQASGVGAQLIAAGDVNQALSGNGPSAVTTNGATTTPTLTLGNVHVGTTAISYNIDNAGTSGPALRGAIQTTVNGANISDVRLTGNGVTAGNWGPVVAGQALSRDINFTLGSAGIYTPLVGQAVNILNNFDNTRRQLFSITSAAGAAAFNLAAAGSITPNPIVLANQRVGGTLASTLTISNTAPSGAFTEGLDAAFGSTTGAALTNAGAVSLLAGGSSNNTAMAVRIDTSTAGAKLGSVGVNLASNGAGTSGLGLTPLTSQTINLSGNVFRLAAAGAHAPEPVVFTNRRIGDAALQLLSLTNTAANDGFSERLNATIGGATAGVTVNGGSFSLLNAGATDNSSLGVGIDTASAGHKAGTVTINLASDGTGTSGFTALGLSAQTVNVSGDVFRLASASAHTPEPIAFANRHVGDAALQLLSLTNTAANDGFSERLNAGIGGATVGVTTNSGSFSGLNAGATNNSNLGIGIDTTSAGHKAGTATINFASDGTGTSGFAALGIGSQTVNVAGDVFRLASANIIQAVQFGNVHVGDIVNRTLTLTNTATNDGFSERLNAAFGNVSDARILTSGSVNQLGAGVSDISSLVVGLDTSTVGSLNGFATVNLTSDGAGTSGLGLSSLGSQNVGVTTNIAVYRLASAGILNAQPINLGAFRVGDAAGRVDLSIRNTAANDGFSESLNASAGVAGSGFTATGSFNLLSGGATNAGGVKVGLDTSVAGNRNGSAAVNFVSDGAGTSNLGQTVLSTQNVNLQGKVYAKAIAEVQTASLDFGIVHVGDAVTAKIITVRNAATGTLADSLLGNISAVPNGFSGGGTLGANGLVAGATDSTNLAINLSTTTAGLFNGNAALAFASHDPDLVDLTLAAQNVALTAQVNNFANGTLQFLSGTGGLSGVGTTFTLDFGTLIQGTGRATAGLSLLNNASGLADTLAGSFNLSGLGAFGAAGFNTFSGIAAGAALSNLTVSFDKSLAAGDYFANILFNGLSQNASTFSGALTPITLNLRGRIDVAAVPVPAAVWMLGSAVIGLIGMRRRKIVSELRN